jgi:cytoskeletal protein CcmA (bactofilin family)
MLQSSENAYNSPKYPAVPAPSTFTPNKSSSISAPTEQATIGRSLVIKGEISGAESIYVDGRIEGSINLPEHRVTVGRNGNVAANINAKEVVIMGKVTGNVHCSDRVDIRSEGTLNGDVVTHRISVEDGAVLAGSVQVQSKPESKSNGKASDHQNSEAKASAAAAGN